MEHVVRPARCLGLGRLQVTQGEPNVDPAQNEDAVFGLYLAPRESGEVTFARFDPAPPARRPGCRAVSRRWQLPERRGVRVGDLAPNPVVPRDGTMGPEAHRLKRTSEV